MHRPLRSVLETNRIKPRPVIWTLLMERRRKRINWLATKDEERRTNRFYAKLHRDRDDMATIDRRFHGAFLPLLP